MARVKVTGVKEASKRLSRNLRIEFVKIFRNQEIRRKVGEIIIEDIKDNVNFGSPSERTRAWREVHDRINTTDPKYNRGRLNATFTGELLEDLKNNIKADTINLQYIVEHSNKLHKKYNGVTKKVGSRSPYKEISRGLVENLGYNYFKLTSGASDKITALIREELFKLLTKNSELT